ncbi:hypothetical protein VNI00_000686 [Paramarasmius palmivorus]|uniref:Uncharacterized protein n=1 Tax=Paramarasmius palmivorus TaxID=297713 RepID=A0AAW0E5V8_9AGAR
MMCLAHDATDATTQVITTPPAPIRPADNIPSPTASRIRTLHKKKSSTDLRDDFYRAAAAELQDQTGIDHGRTRTTSGASAKSADNTPASS